MSTTPVRKIELVTQLHRALREFRKHADDSTGPDLEVRLCVDVGDQNWWVATGDVQFDTVHGDLCGAGTLSVTMTHEEVVEVATELMTEVGEQMVDYDEPPSHEQDADEQDADEQDAGPMSARDMFPSECPDRD